MEQAIFLSDSNVHASSPGFQRSAFQSLAGRVWLWSPDTFHHATAAPLAMAPARPLANTQDEEPTLLQKCALGLLSAVTAAMPLGVLEVGNAVLKHTPSTNKESLEHRQTPWIGCQEAGCCGRLEALTSRA